MTAVAELYRQNSPFRARCCGAVALLGCFIAGASALAAAPEDPSFFEARIKPVLAAHCFECHAGDATESGLRLDSLAAMLAGGERGPAIRPGDAAGSLLVLAIKHADQLHMPPGGKIPQQQIDDLTLWVKAGAHWPGESAAGRSPLGAVQPVDSPFTEEERSFWAFQPRVAPPVPPTADTLWPQTPIDRFVLARLEAESIPPAAPADKRTWLRRVTFDLTGLPPAREDIEAFLADRSPAAREKVVDRLLASPRYGERWGRHWLDVARYADSNGLDENLALANAWRYRDYVVASFNAGKPFDRFLHEQLAGDLLPAQEGRADLDRRIATGFLSIGAKMLAEDDPVKMQMDIIDEQVDTIGQALLGMTLGCARCHDHKFDPFRMSDYYALAGVFKSTKTMENFSVVARWQELPIGSPEELGRHAQAKEKAAAKEAEIAQFQARLKEQLPRYARSVAGWLLFAAHQQSQIDSQAEELSQPPADAVLIEAESFPRGNVQKATSGYGEGIGVLVNQGQTPNFVEYDMTIDSPGLYRIDVRYAAAEPRPCSLAINGVVVEEAIADKPTGGWNPDAQVWRLAAFVELPAGASILRIENPAAFPHIDKFALSPARDGRGAPLAPPIAATPDGRALPRPMVRHFAAYLQQPSAAAAELFAAWRAMAAGDWGAVTSALAGPYGDRLRGNSPPASLEELAARYQAAFEAAETAWRSLEPGESSGAKRLDDPVLEAFRQVLYDPAGPCSLPEKPETWYGREDAALLAALREELKALAAAVPQLPETMAVSEGAVENLRIHLRGSHVTLGAQVPRRMPLILAGDSPVLLPADRSGRLELAEWLTRPDHPLTSRVLANRIWLWHFGEGLVRTPDNFGRLGERPTHPELLDHLAGELIRREWSLKSMHRQIVLSATYGMSTVGRAADEEIDPENRLLRRANRRRLNAEAIRDSLLAAGGSLDLAIGGSLLPTPNRQYVTSTANVDPVIYDTRRRSIYIPVVRSALYDFFQAFDFGDPTVLQGRRESTVVAPQALFLMNSPIVQQQSEALARRLLTLQASGGEDLHAVRINAAHEIVLGRPPTAEEMDDARRFIEADLAQAAQAGGAAELSAWQSYLRALFAASEFLYVD